MRFNGFKNLFVLDLANNHFGDYKHAVKIINEFSKIINEQKLYATIKFQFRNLETYIHKNPKYLKNNSYIERFKSTRFTIENFVKIKNLIKDKNILTSCTPFDEESVDIIEKMKFDIIKIASVSANDFSILERVAQNKIPKIISTGGLEVSEIDKIVSFMQHKGQIFSLMHCTSIYPSENNILNLAFIKNLKQRYKDLDIGWSTHEEPNNFLPAVIAIINGASILERHVGIDSTKYKLNNYSSTPEVFKKWIDTINTTKIINGNFFKKIEINEKRTLSKLSRGMFAKYKIKKNHILTKNDVLFCFPLQKGQMCSSDFVEGIKINKDLSAGECILKKNIKINKISPRLLLKHYIHEVKALINYSGVNLGKEFDLEISHHYGINNFRRVGAFLFNIINKNYCKKIIVMLPKQKHPFQFHKIKEETFHIIYGKLHCTLNKRKHLLKEGDLINIKPGQWHEFSSGKEGCVFEEISTTSLKNDSFYQDPKINKISNNERKTFVSYWGRFEI